MSTLVIATPRKVDTLVNICIKFISMHTDGLGDVGLIPSHLLVKILRAAPVPTLERIEKLNYPQDLGLEILWFDHCRKKGFTNTSTKIMYDKPPPTPPKDYQTWKQFYNAKLNEEEKNKKKLGSALKSMYDEEKKKKAERQTHILTTPAPATKQRTSMFVGGANRKINRGAPPVSSNVRKFSSGASASSSSSSNSQGRLMLEALKDMKKRHKPIFKK